MVCTVLSSQISKNAERERLFDAFRTCELTALVVSRVANLCIGLPDAIIAVQVSGTFGFPTGRGAAPRSPVAAEGDRRPAHFYSVVCRDILDADHAAHLQRFLAEQRYGYRIVDASDLLGSAVPSSA